MTGTSFYVRTINSLIDSGVLDPTSSVVVICGGLYDRDVLLATGFRNVTITNLDEYQLSNTFTPFPWEKADAEDLPFQDESFDLALVNDGLHHCASPHRALLEMYRVARKGIFVIESRDSVLLRLATVLGLVAEYEIEAVARNELSYGGWRNSEIPNFVYRWTEREVIKTIQSFDPTVPANIKFFYGYQVPLLRLKLRKSKVWLFAAHALSAFVKPILSIMPKQGNLFAFYIVKGQNLHPWLRTKYCVDPDWIRARYQISEKGRRICTTNTSSH